MPRSSGRTAPWPRPRVGEEDKLAGIWDAARQEVIRGAFLSTAKPYAGDAFNGVKRALDGQTKAWVNMHTEACQATRLRGEQSEALLDLRVECLRNRLDEVRALTDLFVRADPQVVEKSVEAANALTPLRGCADATELMAQVKPPQDASTRAQVEKHRARQAEVKVLKDTGKYALGLEMAKQLLADARETRYKPFEVEALLIFADLLQLSNQYKEAEDAFRKSIEAADAVGDDQRRAQAHTQLAFVVGYRQTRIEEGIRLAHETEAVVERLGNPPELDAHLQYVLGSLLLRQGKHKEAVQRLERAGDIQQKAFGPESLDLARTFNGLGLALRDSGRYEESLAYLRKALQINEVSLGGEHPHVGSTLNNLATVWMIQGKFDAALEGYRRALAIAEMAFGPSLKVANLLSNIGNVLEDQGRYIEATRSHQRALEMMEKAMGPESADLVPILNNLGNVSHKMGKLEASLAIYRRGLAIAERTLGPEHPKVAMLLNNSAEVLQAQGNFQSALERFRRALAIREKTLGTEHPDVATTLANLGVTLHQQNKTRNFEMAIGYLNRSLVIREKALGPESGKVAITLTSLGSIESERKQKGGLAHIQRALAIQEKILPLESPVIGTTLTKLGAAYLNLRQPFEAKPRLERASKLLESSQADPVDLAMTRFLMARALWDTNSDRARAIALAQQARTVFLRAGKRKSENLQQVEA